MLVVGVGNRRSCTWQMLAQILSVKRDDNEMIARNKREDGKKEEELPITIGLALRYSTTVDCGLLWELMSLLER